MPSDAPEIHASDARSRGTSSGDLVSMRSQFGETRASALVSERAAAGTAFLSLHFPETGTNRVTSDVLDRLADCPEYKLTPVNVAKLGEGPWPLPQRRNSVLPINAPAA